MWQAPSTEAQSWEDDLIAIATRQDQAAFARLFRHFAPRVKSYAMRGGADASSAEEIAQEAMATAWRKAALFDPSKAAASTWLFTIARNLRIDRIRRERRPESDPYDPAFQPAGDPQPDAALRQLQDATAVRRAVAALPDVQREVVMISFYEDEPHGVIADRLGLPLGTVKSRIRLALKKIGEQLSADDFGGGK